MGGLEIKGIQNVVENIIIPHVCTENVPTWELSALTRDMYVEVPGHSLVIEIGDRAGVPPLILSPRHSLQDQSSIFLHNLTVVRGQRDAF